MASGNVPVFASDLLLDFSDLLREKFDRRAALGAHHVMMAAAIVLVFVTRDAVVKSDFAGQAAARQKFQRAVNGGEADARVGFLDQAMQFVGREMFASFQESPQNCAPLFGLLQADATKMLQENSFGFADVLARDGWPIVDSFLQHFGAARKHKMKMRAEGFQTSYWASSGYANRLPALRPVGVSSFEPLFYSLFLACLLSDY